MSTEELSWPMPTLFPASELLLKAEALCKVLDIRSEAREGCVSLKYLVASWGLGVGWEAQGDSSGSRGLAAHS